MIASGSSVLTFAVGASAHPSGRNRKGAQARYVFPSRPRKPAARDGPPRPPSTARPPLGTRLAPWRLAPLFAGGADPGYGTAHGRAAHRNPTYGSHVLAALP